MIPSLLFFSRIEICFNFPYEWSVLVEGRAKIYVMSTQILFFLFGAWICVFRVS